jgi:hypothetical protein
MNDPHTEGPECIFAGCAPVTDESREALAQGPTDPLDALVEEILTASMSWDEYPEICNEDTYFCEHWRTHMTQVTNAVLVKAREMGRADARWEMGREEAK